MSHLQADWLADAPLFSACSTELVHSGPTPFTIPGHKRRAGLLATDLGRLLRTPTCPCMAEPTRSN